MSPEEKAKELDIKGTMATLIISAFGFVAALFWRDAIKEFIDEVIPEGEGLMYQFAVAIIVTIIAVIAIYVVSRYLTAFSLRGAGKKKTAPKK